MKLHSPGFERRLKRGARRTVRQSPTLRKQARQGRRARHYSLLLLVRPGLAALLAGITWWVADRTNNLAITLACINLWMFVWLCVRVRGVLTCLYAHPDLATLSLLPIETTAVFRWQLQKFFRAASLSLLDLVAALSVVGIWREFSLAMWLGAGLVALLAWATFLAAVLLCAARWPGLPYGVVPGLAFLIGLACFFGREFIVHYLLAFLNWCAPELNFLLPTGWPLALLQGALERPPQYLLLLVLLPIGGILWTLKDSLARLRASYVFSEVTVEPPADLIPGATGETEPVPGALTETEPPRHLGTTAIEEIISSRQCFIAPNWQETGRLEQWLWRGLTPREQALTEFVFPDGFHITKAWRKIFRNLLIALLVTLAFSFVAPVLRAWILGLGVFVTFCQALALILGTGSAFHPVSCSGVNIPHYAAYAIGFRELATLLFKCSFVQAPLFIAFITMLVVPIAYFTELPIRTGIQLGLQAGGVLFSLRFVSITFAFSSGTNDSSKVTFRSLFLLFTIIGFGLVFLGLGAAGMIVLATTEFSLPNLLISWALTASAILLAYTTFRVYGWFYHANRFDLMSVPASQS